MRNGKTDEFLRDLRDNYRDPTRVAFRCTQRRD